MSLNRQLIGNNTDEDQSAARQCYKNSTEWEKDF